RLWRGLVHARARPADRRLDDGARAGVRARGDAYRIQGQARSENLDRPADHHTAIRDRPRAHPALRALRADQPGPRMVAGPATVALDLLSAGRMVRPYVLSLAGCVPRPVRRGCSLRPVG